MVRDWETEYAEWPPTFPSMVSDMLECWNRGLDMIATQNLRVQDPKL